MRLSLITAILLSASCRGEQEPIVSYLFIALIQA